LCFFGGGRSWSTDSEPESFHRVLDFAAEIGNGDNYTVQLSMNSLIVLRESGPDDPEKANKEGSAFVP
jgi:hypothetical protein